MSDETQSADSREFTDSDGVHWEVRQIPAPLLNSGDPSTTFGEFASGWLLFSSEHLKKRLTHYPENWRELSPYELEKWCWRAKAERRPGAGTGQTPAYGTTQLPDPDQPPPR
jgi:hypothetical protein